MLNSQPLGARSVTRLTVRLDAVDGDRALVGDETRQLARRAMRSSHDSPTGAKWLTRADAVDMAR